MKELLRLLLYFVSILFLTVLLLMICDEFDFEKSLRNLKISSRACECMFYCTKGKSGYDGCKKLCLGNNY